MARTYFAKIDTFQGGWLGKSKNIDHLSPAKAETRTELGNIM